GEKALVVLGVLSIMFIVMLLRIGRNLNTYMESSLQANRDLHEGEERLRMARDSSGAVNWVWNVGSDQFVCEGNIESIFGSKGNNVEGKFQDCLNHLHSSDRSRVETSFKEALVTGNLDTEARLRWADGSDHWVAIRGKTHYDKGNLANRMT